MSTLDFHEGAIVRVVGPCDAADVFRICATAWVRQAMDEGRTVLVASESFTEPALALMRPLGLLQGKVSACRTNLVLLPIAQ